MQHWMSNELKPELCGFGAISPYVRNTAAPRMQMVGNQAGQALVPRMPDTRYHLTGFEHQLGTTTFATKMPVDGEVIAVIEKFPASPVYGVRDNPRTLVIFEDIITKEIDVVEINSHHVLHQHFGFPYKRNPNVSFSRGDVIPKGTVFADTPAKDELGNAQLGTEANVAHMSIPGVIEDGIVISKSYARRCGVYGIEKRAFGFGSNTYPLNTYGDQYRYKIIPDIGERIGDNGILAATREYDEWLDMVLMTPKAVRRIDTDFDKLVYGVRGARVIDVSVIHDPRNNEIQTPEAMSAQIRDYYSAERSFNQAILNVYTDLKRARRETLRLSRPLHALITRAIDYTNGKRRDQYRSMYQHQQLDEWRVEVTFAYDLVPNVPFKMTNLHGG